MSTALKFIRIIYTIAIVLFAFAIYILITFTEDTEYVLKNPKPSYVKLVEDTTGITFPEGTIISKAISHKNSWDPNVLMNVKLYTNLSKEQWNEISQGNKLSYGIRCEQRMGKNVIVVDTMVLQAKKLWFETTSSGVETKEEHHRKMIALFLITSIFIVPPYLPWSYWFSYSKKHQSE